MPRLPVGLADLLGDVVPRVGALLVLRPDVEVDLVEVQVREVGPPLGATLLLGDLERPQAELEHPLRLVLVVADLLDDAPVEPLLGAERVVLGHVVAVLLGVRHALELGGVGVVVVRWRSAMSVSSRFRRRRAARVRVADGLEAGFDAHPVVPAGVELHRELLGPVLHDAAVDHHVDGVRDDVVQEPLVVGDDERAEVVAAGGVDALRDHLEGVDVEAGVGLVEDRVARLEHQQLQDLGALLLAAREPLVQVALDDRLVPIERLHGALELAVELHDADLVALLAAGVQGEAQEVGDRHAGDLDRVLEGQVEAGAGALVGLQSRGCSRRRSGRRPG
jgi:hypothetical protein